MIEGIFFIPGITFIYLVALYVVSIILPFLVILDVGMTDRGVFDTLGRSKFRWLVALLLLSPTGFGFIAAGPYVVLVRPTVRRQMKLMASTSGAADSSIF